MNDIQSTLCDNIVNALKKTGQCTLIVVYGELARDEGDDLSSVEIAVIVERTLAQDLLHAREQWATRFGAVLSVQYPAEGDWEHTIDILFDESLDLLHLRLSVFEKNERDECVEMLAHISQRILFHDPLFHWKEEVGEKWSRDERRVYAEERVRIAWHRIPEVVRAWKRERMPEALSAYVTSLNDLAFLVRVQKELYPVERGLEDVCVDVDDATARMFQSLSTDLRTKEFGKVLSSFCDALEAVQEELRAELGIIPPSKVIIRSIRECCEV
ncbi:MAG: hypothetical protein KIH62_004045 [Candidatus Kerfeldbacteria bacterium]|nr:hypothetical protein [Candidatus Kerfeldbacteria bacterium]